MPPQKTDLKTPPVLRTEEVEIEKLIGDQKEFDRHTPEQSEQVAQNIAANGLLQTIAITEDYRVIFGHGRVLAVRKLNWKTIRAAIYAKGLPEIQFRLIRASENLQRNELTPFRKYLLCKEIQALHGCDQQTLAALLHLTPAAITALMAVEKCIPAVMDALKAGQLGTTDVYAISKAPQEAQQELLKLKLGGASRDTLERHGRKLRAEGKQAAKSGRIRVPLPGGSTVTVAGEEMSLEEAIEAMSDAVKLARAALAKGITAKSAQSVWKDLAAAG